MDHPPYVIDANNSIRVLHCHPDDQTLVKITPLNPKRMGGLLLTTNNILSLTNLSMILNGTNLFEIRTICHGETGEIRSIWVNIKKIPRAPTVERLVVETNFPPIPQGMIPPISK